LNGIPRAKATLRPPDYPNDEATAKQKTETMNVKARLSDLAAGCLSAFRNSRFAFVWRFLIVIVFLGTAGRRKVWKRS
jgi:hypothetical protein